MLFKFKNKLQKIPCFAYFSFTGLIRLFLKQANKYSESVVAFINIKGTPTASTS